MKTNIKYLIAFFIVLLAGAEMQAQFGNGSGGGYGYGGYGNGGGRGLGRGYNSAIPRADTPPEPPKPKTADEIVDGEMPKIASTLDLNAFETAVLSTTLKKYVQERIELQILKLPGDKMREAFEKITIRQDEELKAGLPIEKYEGFVQMQKDGVAKMQKEQKKAEKKKGKKKKKKKDPE